MHDSRNSGWSRDRDSGVDRHQFRLAVGRTLRSALESDGLHLTEAFANCWAAMTDASAEN